MFRALFATLSVCLLLLSGCGTTSGCADNADCADMQVCRRNNPNRPGTCTNVECVTNEHCGIGSYCEPTGNTCAAGCSSDLDCRAGQACDVATNSCQAYGCRDTDLDCGYGEFCDVASGNCYEDSAPHCQANCDPFVANSCGGGNTCVTWNLYNSCDVYNEGAECGSGQYCAAFEIDENSSCDSLFNSGCPSGWNCAFFDMDGDGVGDGDFCYQGSCFDTRCMVGCQAEGDCPRGYFCGDVGLGSNVCYGDCDFMEQW